ncbi:hypothetical protein ACWCXB_32510 [Streptomyces sp. NPDC001514]
MISLPLAGIAQVTRGRLHSIPDDNARVTGPISFDGTSPKAACSRASKGRILDGHDFAARPQPTATPCDL